MSLVVSFKGILAELLLDCDIHLVQQALVTLLFVFPVLFLVTGFVAVFKNDVPVELEVEDQMLNCVLSLEHTVLERVLSQVVRCQGVVGSESLNNIGFALFSSKLLLIDPSLIVLVHIEQIGIIICTLRGIFFLNGLLALSTEGGLSFSLGGLGCFRRHFL